MASPIGSSSGNPHLSDPGVSKFVKDNLSGRDNYEQWRQQMLKLINSYGLDGFITGTVKTPPKTITVTIPEDGAAAASRTEEIENQDFISWKASNDFLLKCIRKTLAEDINQKVKRFKNAKWLWTRLEEMCGNLWDADASKFVKDNLSGSNNYEQWRQQMLNPINSHGLNGFIDGTVEAPPKSVTVQDTGGDSSDGDPSSQIENEDYGVWKRSDKLLQKCIRSTLTEDIRQQVRRYRTAKGLWTKLEKLCDIALRLLKRNPKLACMDPSPLLAIVKKPSSFPSGTNFLERIICSVKQRLHAMVWAVAAKLVPQINQIIDKKFNHDQALELVKLLCQEIAKSEFSSPTRIFTEPLKQALSEGVPQIVGQILPFYVNPVSLQNENWQSIFQKAIGQRREEVFFLINRRENFKRIFLSIEDESRNNVLHLAGHLAPPQILRHRIGAALQMQEELQWFKEIEKNVPPSYKEEKNAKEMTPIEVFTDEHQELVKEAERWMKDTANSCTIVATLIATVVFAAAITVPGGNNNDSGQPIFFKQHVFFLFGIFDALALFSSISSVLMFLSITTSRYAVDDFLYALPNRLIIGFGTLFFSILSTMIAFSATLYLVFGENKSWIRIPIVVLACIPVIIFVALQLPLLVEIIELIFGKKSDRGLQKSGEETEPKSPVNMGLDAIV